MLLSWFLWAVLAYADQAQFDFDKSQAQAGVAALSSYKLKAALSLMWGPYRSGNYFGLRLRHPESLLTGLMWFNADTREGISTLHNTYEQMHDLGKATWVDYDPRVGGTQVIVDNECHVNITIHFVKSSGGSNWGVRVQAVPHEGYEESRTSVVWYAGLESETDTELKGLLTRTTPKLSGYPDTLEFSGIHEDLGIFDMKISRGPATNKRPSVKLLMRTPSPKLTQHMSLRVPNGYMWRVGDIFHQIIQESIKDFAKRMGEDLASVPPCQGLLMRNLYEFDGNLHFIQNVFEGAFEFDVVCNIGASQDEKISFETIGDRIKEVHELNAEKFDATFDLSGLDDKHKAFAKEALLGLLGGLSYSYGLHLVDRTTQLDDEDVDDDENENDGTHLPKLTGQPEGPYELFTLVPSRPFFPRGFYWDEGFHLLPILDYDSDLALEILHLWFSLIDENGWVAREQILGEEARARVPPEFVVQSPHIVNPPTLLLAFTKILDMAKSHSASNFTEDVESVEPLAKLEKLVTPDIGHHVITDPESFAEFTRQHYPALKRHYEAFRTSQAGETEDFERSTEEVYRWRGRTATHCLALGLDDYPRVLPMDIAEAHVDLLCWIGVMTRSIKQVAEVLGDQDDVKRYTETEQQIQKSIAENHWSAEDKAYCDLSVDDEDNNIFVCHKGYISLFPFITKFIPGDDVEKLEAVVDLIANPEELWTDFGIRSLSKSDEFYKTEEDYWRLPIWINVNYLVLEALAHYHGLVPEDSPELAAKLDKVYTELRLNLIKNMLLEWERTGFVWELYEDQNGHAKGAKNFLGWSSLVILMMKMSASLA